MEQGTDLRKYYAHFEFRVTFHSIDCHIPTLMGGARGVGDPIGQKKILILI
jgi:hypothetical protein